LPFPVFFDVAPALRDVGDALPGSAVFLLQQVCAMCPFFLHSLHSLSLKQQLVAKWAPSQKKHSTVFVLVGGAENND